VAAQILAVTAVNLRSIPQRLGNSLVIVIGVAGVVAVLLSALAMSSGFRRTIDSDARIDRAIVMTRGAENEAGSALSRANVAAVHAAPGVRRDSSGEPIVSGEVLLVAPVARKADGSDANITLRGVGGKLMSLRPEIKIIAGRMFQPALHEVLVGQSAQKQFAGLDIGSQVRLQEGDWTVVGVFSTNGSSRESELLADAETVMSAYRENTFNSVTVLLESQRGFNVFKDALSVDPTLIVDVRSEPEYLASVSQSINRLLKLVAYAIGGIMAIGAIFAALNTMYSSISSRAAEIATLRALGFGSGAVLASVLIEGLLLSAAGGAIGVAIAYFGFNGRAISTLGGAIWDSQLVYSLTITPSLIGIAVVLACAIGLMGGLLPGMRAARMPVAEALRSN
ncbi:MAG: ABC transporter permease, partial [Steroidobacter sp.]